MRPRFRRRSRGRTTSRCCACATPPPARSTRSRQRARTGRHGSWSDRSRRSTTSVSVATEGPAPRRRRSPTGSSPWRAMSSGTRSSSSSSTSPSARSSTSAIWSRSSSIASSLPARDGQELLLRRSPVAHHDRGRPLLRRPRLLHPTPARRGGARAAERGRVSQPDGRAVKGCSASSFSPRVHLRRRRHRRWPSHRGSRGERLVQSARIPWQVRVVRRATQPLHERTDAEEARSNSPR